jgi:Fur family ferric uptake transcriptional regulator
MNAANERQTAKSRNTEHKQLIRSVIEDNCGRHMSTEEIYELVKKSHSGIGIATVYRNIKSLQEEGLILKEQFGDKESARYEMSLQSGEHTHHHLICTECGEVCDVEDDLLDRIEALVSDKNGFRIVDHRLNFFGICKKCQESSK